MRRPNRAAMGLFDGDEIICFCQPLCFMRFDLLVRNSCLHFRNILTCTFIILIM